MNRERDNVLRVVKQNSELVSRGFTVAEGLIVAAVIGVVAALFTVPAFVHEEQVNKKIEDVNCIVKLADGACINKILSPDKDYAPINKTECEQAVLDGKLGIKSCKYDKDYWAGAVKACGGIDKMLTMQQLGELAAYLYNYSGTIKARKDVADDAGYKLDLEKAEKFLAASPYGERLKEFYVWSAQEDDDMYGYARYFMADGTYWFENARELNTRLAVCIDN